MGCNNSAKKPAQKTLNVSNGNSQNNSENNSEVKVVVLGDANVGKTSITMQYCKNVFQNAYIATIGAAFLQKRIVKDGNVINYQIWDTGGSERFRSMAKIYYNGAKVAILVCDITDSESLKSLEYWLGEISKNTQMDNTIMCLACNKIDLEKERKLTKEMMMEFKNKHNLDLIYDVSAKNNFGIVEMFDEIAELLLERQHK